MIIVYIFNRRYELLDINKQAFHLYTVAFTDAIRIPFYLF
jgi:hypothetical protein